MAIVPAEITAGVLAGGGATRLGGIDKGWFEVAGRTLIEHTLARLADQCETVLISANRNIEAYRRLGWPVIADDDADGGPLAGIDALLQAASTPYLLTVPVDTPALPRDLAARLAAALAPGVELSLASGPRQRQPLHALMPRSIAPRLAAARARGVRSVYAWQQDLACAVVCWPDAREFANINTAEDAAAFAAHPPVNTHRLP